MARSRTKNPLRNASPLMVRLDEDGKSALNRAAQLRGMSVSDYVRSVLVPQARREVAAAGVQVIALAPEEQHAFWTALNEPAKLTAAQKKLGALMRGES